jgi:DNA-directed RNA polymerase specialized sigma subunit
MLDKEKKNQIIIAYFSENKKQADIARDLDIPKQTVSRIINKILDNILKRDENGTKSE